MKKRLFSTLLVFCMVLTLLPGAARANEKEEGTIASGKCGENLTWTLIGSEYSGNYTLAINGSGDMSDYASGQIYNTNAPPWASWRSDITSVIIDNGVTSIGHSAFWQCALTDIDIPDSVTSIGSSAFLECHQLKNIDIPNSVTIIGDSAFSSCDSLESVNIPDSVIRIGSDSFAGAPLASVSIPCSVTSIGVAPFGGCPKSYACLTAVNVDKNHPYYCSVDGVWLDKDKTMLILYPQGRIASSYTVPSSVKIIYPRAFEYCYNLKSLDLTGVVTIGTNAVSGGVSSIILSNSLSKVDWGAFGHCTDLTDVYYSGSASEWNAIDISNGNDPLLNATIHYNSTGPDGQGGTGEDPKPNPNPDQPIIPDYIDEHIKNYSLKFHLGTAGEVNMDLQWGWSLFGAASNSYNIPLSAAAMMLSASAEHSEVEVKFLLDSLGFKTTDSKNYGHSWMEIDYPGVAFGYQEVNGKHIFAIVIRGTNSDELEDILSDAMGFVPSANNLRLQWESFVKDICKLDLADIEDSSRFLVTGHSLGGATANVLAKSLSHTYGSKNVYAYAFAPPKPVDFLTGSISAGAYDNIFNVVNIEDGVTYLPPDGFLFTRYGRDIPFHRDRNDGFYAKFKELAGRDFNKGFLGFGSDSAHDTAVYMAYVLTGQLSDTIRVIKCACPVDVEIYDAAGILVGQVQNNVASDTESEKVYIRVIGDKKYIYVLVDGDYTIKMTGTDDGTMTYSVQDINGGGEVVEEKVYQNVKLNSSKLLSSIVTNISVTNPSNVPLYVVDENGEPEREVLSDGQGTEIPINNPDNPDNIYTIIFDANGGTVNSASLTADANGKLSSLPTPSRNGYTFNGWFTAPSGGTQITTAFVFTESITLYAQWTYVSTSSGGSSSGGSSSGGGSSGSGYPSTTYNITIPTVSGGTVAVSPKSAARGTTVTITAAPTAGYELISLTATDSNGKVLSLTGKGDNKYIFIMPSGEVTLNVVFQPIQPSELETPWDNPFTDVSENEWYYDAVRFVYENGLMNGYDNNTFAPNANLSRAMLTQILYNKEGRPVSSGSSFADVTSDAWYSEAVAWAAAQGIVSGYGNGLFGPNDHITREQLAVMLWRYAGEPAATNKKLHFNDVDEVSGYALDALCWATENGIINGKGGGILDPRGQATRAQVAQMLMNYLRK